MVLNPNSYQAEVVYDLDSLLLDPDQTQSIRMEDFETVSKHKISKASASLEFESRFESGNLRRALRVWKKTVENYTPQIYYYFECVDQS